MANYISWFISGALAATIILVEDQQVMKGADFGFFVFMAVVVFICTVLGPIALTAVIGGLLLKFIFDR